MSHHFNYPSWFISDMFNTWKTIKVLGCKFIKAQTVPSDTKLTQVSFSTLSLPVLNFFTATANKLAVSNFYKYALTLTRVKHIRTTVGISNHTIGNSSLKVAVTACHFVIFTGIQVFEAPQGICK